jgi:nitroreductase
MTRRPLQPQPWPLPPGPDATPESRLRWYAAVARWAPSKHNTQPWRFLVSEAALEVWPDQARALPESDPGGRELHIACGAAAHLAVIAARAQGHQLLAELLPEGAGGCLVRLRESGAYVPTDVERALLEVVADRRTDRGPLDADQLPHGLAFQLQSCAGSEGASLHLVRTPGARLTLAELIEHADRLLSQRGIGDREAEQWARTPEHAADDGVPVDHTRGPAASYRAEFVQRDFSFGHAGSAQDRPGPDQPLVGVLCTPRDGPEDWLVAGRGLMAVLLHLTVAGGSASYLNQPVEEPHIRTQLRDQLALDGVPQLVLRMGAGGPVDTTPRRRADDVIVTQSSALPDEVP